MSTNHSPSGRTPLHTEDNDRAHQLLDHAGQQHHKKHAPKGKPGITLNVTSMVDILFNLLVYFIVTANFAMDEASLKTRLPPPPNASGPKDDDPDGGTKRMLDVRSTKDTYGCILQFEGRNVADMATLRSALVAANKKTGKGNVNPDLDPIQIRPDGKVRWQYVVDVFNQTIGAGYKKVGFGELAAGR